ncbi:MAG: hypothetical protein QOI22_1417 [Verrucomicrobiota bacterium]
MKLNPSLFVAIALVAAAASRLGMVAAATPAEVDPVTRRAAQQSMLSLPLRFEENNGSFDPQVKYLARGPSYTLFLTPAETVLTIRQGGQGEAAKSDAKLRSVSSAKARAPDSKASIVRVRLEGANRAGTLRGESELSAPTNYFIGNDPAKWRAARNYERVRCESVYPGVDVLYHGKQQELEYDFEVAPGADPGRIVLRYEGVRRLHVDVDGSLVLKLKAGGELRQHRPVAYQVVNGERREVASRYLVKGKQRMAFELGDYDASQVLVIDPPVLSYSTYVGAPLGPGGASTDIGHGIAVDSAGHVYVVGETTSTNFPTLNQYQTDQTNTDAFVIKLDTNASGAASLLYSTYLGGSGIDIGHGIAADSAGNAYVTGQTLSTDFPTLNQYQTDQGGADAFVTKLDTNATGAASLLYSTYLGGIGTDLGIAIAVGGLGNVLVTGDTDSNNFPTFHEYETYQPGQTSTSAFVTKLDPSASGAASLLYSTYLFGVNGENHGTGVAVGAGGKIFVTGWTESGAFPTLNEYQTDQPGVDAFVAKLDPSLSGVASLLYSTYLGGGGDDIGNGIAVDSAGNAYVTGTTSSTNFPVLNQYQGNQPNTDAFVTKLDPDASGAASLLYSTYLGGSGFSDIGNAIAVDSAGNAYVTGETDSTDFPTLDPLQTDQPNTDAFVAKVNTNASGVASLLFCTYLGGDGVDAGKGIALDSAGQIYVTGQTASTNFPTLNQYQTHQVLIDSFVTKYGIGLKINSITRVGNNIVLQCLGVPNQVHTVLFSPDLIISFGTPAPAPAADANGAFQYTDTSPGTKRFYKVTFP